MDYIIREILQEEYGLLEHFLYEAIFVPEGMAAPPQGTAPGAGLDAAQLMQALAALGAAPGAKGAGQA